jgi:hypothetical protein
MLGLEGLLYLSTLMISIFVVGSAADNGFLNGRLTRAFGGISTQIVSLNFLNQYTGFETFLRACFNGQIGITGYAFLLSFSFLLIVWANNLFEYRQAIV